MKEIRNKWKLMAYDLAIYMIVATILCLASEAIHFLKPADITVQLLISGVCVAAARTLGGIYHQIWRYGGVQCYLRLILVDGVAFLLNVILVLVLPVVRFPLAVIMLLLSMNLVASLVVRMFYRYFYKGALRQTREAKLQRRLLHLFAGWPMEAPLDDIQKIKVAIIGAGRVGVTLAEDMLSNASGPYIPRCFIDNKKEKVGREIHGIPVLGEGEEALKALRQHEVQEIVLAVPNIPDLDRGQLYSYYTNAGFKVKVYDYPVKQTSGKRQLREFDIEELLFRKPVTFADPETVAYYENKRVLITGGGGSIGSELCRQLSQMNPSQIVVLDIYENGAYDVQQELKITSGGKLNIQIEICSITNRRALARVFEAYHPQIVINAAAHKHVPLMEHNCLEAVENNVFGTKNLIELCEQYHAERFMMVSTDKAVNPTNVMGATKRMCEMMVQSASTWGSVKYSATRFGNVLGSAGSVIPLFKRQIASGGPVTITDRRIIRYFMTIPEASQLVLQSGAMAKNGELFVLDMGSPVKILDLAENMIRLSGARDIEIVETGLRPGEKLYEELLVRTEELDKTANSLIFVERDVPLEREEIRAKLEVLKAACALEDDDAVRQALRQVVPTYRSPEEVNRDAEKAREMGHAPEAAAI